LRVIVRPADASLALALFRQTGWRISTADARPDSDHPVLLLDAAGHAVRLHCRFMADTCGPSADDWLWRRTVPIRFLDVEALQPDATAALVRTVADGVRPASKGAIGWIADAHMIVQEHGSSVDWTDLVAFARSHRLTRRLRLGLAYLAARFAAPAPDAVLDELSASDVSLVERIEDRFLCDAARGSSLADRIALAVALEARRSTGQGGAEFAARLLARGGRGLRRTWAPRAGNRPSPPSSEPHTPPGA
jgi:hypothetical protein